ncbi:hypothetical protein [Natronomonas sp. EA1]|uniref:hypothetical protein n=1 Tax=Natronomonas sp. EA1 TaxID=3421655 RepID=UPI003EB8EFC5
MTSPLYRATLFATYQTTIALGVLLLPIALLARKAGLPLPLDRVIARVGAAYEAANAQ